MIKRTSFYLLLCTALVSSIGALAQNNNGAPTNGAPNNNPPAGVAALQAAAATASSNHGHFVCTAAITTGGGIFSGEYVDAAQTSRLGVGTYQVAFHDPCPNVQIANGWFRIVQPDTLMTGTLPSRTCTVADRAGVPSAIWVQCFNAAGGLTDTSFTVHVSR